MNAYQEVPSLENPEDILVNCSKLNPQDDALLHHPVIERFGNPKQTIYVDEYVVIIDEIQYNRPLILPVFNSELELVQCAVLQDNQPVKIIPERIGKGFAYYGELHKDKPVIITYSLEAFFKIAQTGYTVALVVLPTLCNTPLTELKPFDLEQIQYVINQLSNAEYKHLYMPVRPENIKAELFQKLEQNTAVRLINQYQCIEEIEFLTELSRDESKEEITAFLDEAIALLPKQNTLPKGHLAKPMKWGNGYFHITEDGLFFVEEDKNGITQKRFISSPVLVIAKTRDDSSNNWGVLLKWTDDSSTVHTQALSMELFQTDGADLRKALAYQGVMIAPDQRARNLFQCYLMSYQTGQYALCVDRVGWHGEVFVLPHQQIGENRNGDLIVYQSIASIPLQKDA